MWKFCIIIIIIDIPYLEIIYLHGHFYIVYSDGKAGWHVLFNFSVFIFNNIFIIALILLTLNSLIKIQALDKRHYYSFIRNPFPLFERSLTLFWTVCVWLPDL